MTFPISKAYLGIGFLNGTPALHNLSRRDAIRGAAFWPRLSRWPGRCLPLLERGYR